MPRKQTPTVQDAIEQYIASRRGLSIATQKNDRTVLRHLSREIGAERQIGYVTAEQVERYFINLNPNLAPASFNQWRRKVRLFLEYAERHRWIKPQAAVNLLADVPRPRNPQKDRLRLAPGELVDFLEALADPRDRALVACAINTAMRGSELAALRVKDVNLEADELHLFRRKTGQHDHMQLTPALARELRSWLTYYAANISEPLSDQMVLFPARQRPQLGPYKPGGAEMLLGALRPQDEMSKPFEAVKRGLRALGIEIGKGEGVHTLRRSAARAMFDHSLHLGYDGALRIAQAFLGHANSQTTELYLGLDLDRQRRDEVLRSDFLPFDRADNVVPMRAAQR